MNISLSKHIMLDIETMGTQSYSSIVSIGALKFDIKTGETGKQFYTNVDLQSCHDLGLITTGDTVMWWMQRSREARQSLIDEPRLPIIDALRMFATFCTKTHIIWGNSARFDCGILQNAYDKAKIPIPWDFRNEKCLRTLVGFAPEIKEKCSRTGEALIAHNALADCYHQVNYCSATWQYLCHEAGSEV